MLFKPFLLVEYSGGDKEKIPKERKQKEVNNILEKISKSGYSSLNEKEKEILFNESKK